MIGLVFKDDERDTPGYWRAKMVAEQLEGRKIRDPRVLDAFRRIPRHEFCPGADLPLAYGDHPVEIGHGQTVSQPYMIAWMLQESRLQPADRVLEIGTGSGYQTALLASLVANVFSVECIPELLTGARERLDKCGFTNIEFRFGDGSVGWAQRAPFDVVLYSAAAPEIPDVVREQLSIGGRILAPIGRREHQTLVRIERTGESDYREQDLGGCVFVPLRGAFGWTD